MPDSKNPNPTFSVDNKPVGVRTHRNVEGTTEIYKKASIDKLSEIRRGQFHTAATQSTKEVDKTSALLVHSRSFKKDASLNSPLNGSGSSTQKMAPEIYSPLFQVANLNLPRDRATMNAWNRVFYDTHPIVRNAITLHSTYPISKINIKCKHKKVEQFFNDMCERIDLFDTIAGVALEFWKMGEAFPYAELDEANGTWSSIVIQNPDYIVVQKSPVSNVPIIALKPDATLQRIVSSNNATDIKLRQQIPDHIIHHIKRKEPIPLDNFNVTHLKMLSSMYDIRGTSIIVSCYKDLMLYDKLREAKFAQADNLINPITLVKVGGSGEGEYHPSPSDLDQWRQIIEEAQYDKDFKIISHAGVSIERVGANSGILDTQNDFNFIKENLYSGLMVPKSVMDQEGAAYASASIGLEVLRTRYITFRNMLEKWLEKKIFAPISELQGFFEYRNKEKVLIVPEVDWNHINLYDLNDYINALSTYVQSGQVSVHTLYRSLGLNWEEEQRQIREEQIRKQIFEKEIIALRSMSISELRSIGPDEPIVEKAPERGEPLPGEMQAAPEGGGMGGPIGGGMPDLGGLGGPMPGPSDMGGSMPGPPMGGGPEGSPLG